jgi:transcriptional regulator with XRE-family HTH domain
MKMNFKENLKTLLEYSGLMVKELSSQSGVNKRTIDNYLSTHNSKPSAEAAVAIAEVLGVSVEYLMRGENTDKEKMLTNLSLEIRQLLETVKTLDKDDRDIVLTVARRLKKREELQHSAIK